MVQIDGDGLSNQIFSTFELAAHLNLGGADANSALLTQKLAAAVNYVERLCGGTIPTPIPDPLRAAVLMLAAHLYENREATAIETFGTVPFGFDELIAPYRAWEF